MKDKEKTGTFGGGSVGSASEEKSNPPKQRTKKNAKPQGYKDFEVLAKGILDASGVSYYEWLHKKHQEIILEFNVTNRKDVVELVEKEGMRND